MFYSAIGQLTFRYLRQGSSAETSFNFAIGLDTQTTYTVLVAVDLASQQLGCTVYNTEGTRLLEQTRALSSGLVDDCIVGDADCFMTVGARSLGSSITNAWTGSISRAILYPAQVVAATEVEDMLVAEAVATTTPSPASSVDLLTPGGIVGLGMSSVRDPCAAGKKRVGMGGDAWLMVSTNRLFCLPP